MQNKAAILSAGLILAGCVMEGGTSEDATVEAGCGAAGLQDLAGQDLAAFERMNWQGASRILRPGQAVTMDFSAERLNIEVDGDERISRVFCG